MVGIAPKWHSPVFPLLNFGVQHRKEGIYSSSSIQQNSIFFLSFDLLENCENLSSCHSLSPPGVSYPLKTHFWTSSQAQPQNTFQTPKRNWRPDCTAIAHWISSTGRETISDLKFSLKPLTVTTAALCLCWAALTRKLLAFFKRI